jgi:Fe-S-cluster containining protein
LLDDGVAPVMQRYQEHIACHRGCSDCCHQTFRVSDIEGAWLREGLHEAAQAVRDDIVARARVYRPDERMGCPVLDREGSCRLYSHRPRICRKYGIPLWHPDRPDEVRTCALNFRNVIDLDAALVVEPQAGWAEDWIALREQLELPARPNRTIAEHLQDG